MSEPVQKVLLYFAAAMVGMIALLLALQVGLGALAEEEPQVINPRSLVVAALFAAGLTLCFGAGSSGRDDQSP